MPTPMNTNIYHLICIFVHHRNPTIIMKVKPCTSNSNQKTNYLRVHILWNIPNKPTNSLSFLYANLIISTYQFIKCIGKFDVMLWNIWNIILWKQFINQHYETHQFGRMLIFSEKNGQRNTRCPMYIEHGTECSAKVPVRDVFLWELREAH